MTQPCNPHSSPGVGGNTLRRCWELDPLGSLGVPKEKHMGCSFQNVGEVCPPAYPPSLAELGASGRTRL